MNNNKKRKVFRRSLGKEELSLQEFERRFQESLTAERKGETDIYNED